MLVIVEIAESGRWDRICLPMLSSPGVEFLLEEMASSTSCSVIWEVRGWIGGLGMLRWPRICRTVCSV